MCRPSFAISGETVALGLLVGPDLIELTPGGSKLFGIRVAKPDGFDRSHGPRGRFDIDLRGASDRIGETAALVGIYRTRFVDRRQIQI